MPMFGQGNQLPPWLQQQDDPTGNPWGHVNNMVRALMSGGLRRQQGQQQGQPGQVPGQGGSGQPHFDVPLSGPYAKPEQTMPTTSDPAVMPPVPFLGAGGLPGQAVPSPMPPTPTPPTQANATPLDPLLHGANPWDTMMSMSQKGQVPTPQSAVNWMMNTGANGQVPSGGDTMKWMMGGGQGGFGSLFGNGFANLFKGAGQDPGQSNPAGSQTTGGFA